MTGDKRLYKLAALLLPTCTAIALAGCGAFPKKHSNKHQDVVGQPPPSVHTGDGQPKSAEFVQLVTSGDYETLVEHKDEVTGSAFLPSGTEAISASKDGRVCRWDLKKRQVMSCFHDFFGGVGHLAVSTDGSLAVLALDAIGGAVEVWDIATQKQVQRIDGGPIDGRYYPAPTAIAISRDNKLVAAAIPERGVRIWEISTGNLVKEFAKMPLVMALQFANDGATLFASSTNRFTSNPITKSGIHALHIGDGSQALLVASEPGYDAIALNPSGDKLASSQGGLIETWDVTTGARLRFRNHSHSQDGTSGACRLAWAVDGKAIISTAGKGAVATFEADTLRHLRDFGGKWSGQVIYDVSFAPDSRNVVFASADRAMYLLDSMSKDELPRFMLEEVNTIEVASIAYSPSGKQVAIGTAEYAGEDIRVFEVDSGVELFKLKSGVHGAVRTIAYNADGTKILFGNDNGSTLQVWDAKAGGGLSQPMNAGTWNALTVAYGLNDLGATAGQDGLIRLWKLADQSLVKSFGLSGTRINSIAFAKDGTKILSGSEDKIAHIWSIDTGSELIQFKGHIAAIRAVALSNDGKLAASTDGNVVKVWNTTDGAEVAQLEEIPQTIWRAYESLAFSNDSKLLIAAGGSTHTKVWDVQTGKISQEIVPRMLNSYSFATFSPDDRFIFGASLAAGNLETVKR